MDKKYKFTGEEKQVNGRTLKRIVATKCFGEIGIGEVGGWIEKEMNLSHEGNCWVYHNAEVYGNAIVKDNAKVKGYAKVYGYAHINGSITVCSNALVENTRDVISFLRVGSRKDTLTAFRTKEGFNIKVGCFLGDLEEFLEKSKKHTEIMSMQRNTEP